MASHRASQRGATILVLWACGLTSVRAEHPQLLNPGFEAAQGEGLVGWKVIAQLDPHRYGEPDFKQHFDEIQPVQGVGGYRSRHCLSFPREGAWMCPVWAHSNGNAQGINGKPLGKAVVYQTVRLPAGRYRFSAMLRTAEGHLHSALFSLGVSMGAAPEYRHDDSSGICWTRDLARRRSETGGKSERGEWMRYATEPFELVAEGPVTVWVRFDYANENQFKARWQADDAAIESVDAIEAESARHPCTCAIPADPVRHREFCGDAERFLIDDGGSRIVEAPEVRLFRHAREIPPGRVLRYRLPHADGEESPTLLVAGSGHLSITAGRALPFNLRSEVGKPSAREWALPAASTHEGMVELSVTSSGNQPARLYELELARVGRTSIRLSHVVAKAVAVPWVVGTWDTTAREFLHDKPPGLGSTLRMPDSLPPAGRWALRFDHQPRNGHHYYLIHGLLRGECRIDVGDDGIIDWIARTTGEEIVDVNVTDLLHPGENMVTIETTGEHDFAALVETCPGGDDLTANQLTFEGDLLAEQISRTVAHTWFWLRELHYEPTGFVDASIPLGKWHNQYWPIDTAFALREWVGSGPYEEARRIAAFSAARGWQGHDSNRSGGRDNTGGNILVRQYCDLIHRADFDPQVVADLWPAVESHAAGLIEAAAASPYGLVRGTNWENAGNREKGPCYALSTSLGGALSLQAGASVAEHLGKQDQAQEWRAAAERIRSAVLERLVLRSSHRCPSGFEMPAGTWAYGLRTDGTIEDQPLAGFLWSGAGLCEVQGLVPSDREVLEVYDRTLTAALPLFDRGGTGTVSGYATSYDGANATLILAAMCDRMAPLHGLLERLGNENGVADEQSTTQAELSRWAVGGPDGWVEDTNLVVAAGFLWPLRILAGIDDSLLGSRGQLALVPRLPREWKGLRINQWPVRCLDDQGRPRWAKLSYEMHRHERGVDLEVHADVTIPGVRIRLGPFPSDTRIVKLRVNGSQVPSDVVQSGDAAWAWLGVDIGPHQSRVTASIGG